MKSVEINHISLFTFGFLFYWILPLMVRPDGDMFAIVSDSAVNRTLCVMLGIYLCFLLGDWVGRVLRYIPRESSPLRGCPLMLGFISFCTLAFAVQKRSELFVSYSDNVARGTLTAITLLIFAIALTRASFLKESTIKNRFFVTYFAFALLLLFMGQRLYFVSTILALLVYRSCYFQKLRVKKLLLGGVCGLAFIALIGVLRSGDVSLGLGQMVINVLAEPLLTSISLFDFLKYHEASAFALPASLAAQFLNLVPSAILPNKLALIESWRGGIYSPVGAMNSYVSWMVNFGIVGSFLFALSLGFWLRWLRAKETPLTRVIYSMLCGFLAFTFFRDEFAVSIVKNMLEVSILFPAIIVLASRSLPPPAITAPQA